ncbi:MAG: phosphate acetyltransferase [Candidatus Hydrogenedentota bacterium]
MGVLDDILSKAKKDKKRIIYSESNEPRILKASRKAMDDGVIEQAILVGEKNSIEKACKDNDVSLKGYEIIEPQNDSDFNKLAQELYHLRKHKGMTEDEAVNLSKTSLIYANLLLRSGRGDGIVTGSVTTTGDVVKAAVTIVKPREGVKAVSSCFIMETPNCHYGNVYIFADAGVIPNPDPEQLSDIAIASYGLYNKLIGGDAVIAFLSFSTKGSAEHEHVDKVKKAYEIFKSKYPEIPADGELQGDAAIVPDVGKRKAPESKFAGKANILIFPDLDAANICYKLVERMGGAKALGPILQGLSKPVNDLSRGCSVSDIYGVTAITSLLAD